MNMLLIIVLSIRLLLTAVVVSQKWIHQPENVAVLVGNDLTLRCLPKSENVSVNWVFYTNGTDNLPMALTDDNGCLENNPWKYKCSEGNRILNFNCTDKTYAGPYECRISTTKTGMELTILESDPICNTKNITVVENNYIEMWCNVNYSGHWAPVMEWGQDVTDNIVLEEFNGNVTNRATNNGVKSTLRLLVDSRRHNSRYYCKTYFTNDSIFYVYRKLVQNVPTYNHTWISPIISVLYTSFYKFAVITGSLISCFIVLLVATIFAMKNVKERCMGKNSRKSLDIISSHEVLPLGIAEDNYAVSYEDSTAPDERSSRAANLSSDQGATEGPVYSVVHKNRVTYEQSTCSHTEEAVCNNSIYKMPRANRRSKQTENKKSNLDGIIYTELDQVPRESRVDPNIVRVQFKKSEYVAIDHTLQVPSPVPQLNFNLNHL